jgi:hypothetical protein
MLSLRPPTARFRSAELNIANVGLAPQHHCTRECGLAVAVVRARSPAGPVAGFHWSIGGLELHRGGVSARGVSAFDERSPA